MGSPGAPSGEPDSIYSVREVLEEPTCSPTTACLAEQQLLGLKAPDDHHQAIELRDMRESGRSEIELTVGENAGEC